jgi:hypothetical protein
VPIKLSLQILAGVVAGGAACYYGLHPVLVKRLQRTIVEHAAKATADCADTTEATQEAA